MLAIPVLFAGKRRHSVVKTPIVPLPPKVVRARLAATAMALLLLAGVALQVQASYNAAVAAAETTARALVKAVAERVEGGVRAVDGLLNEFAAAAQAGQAGDAEFTQRALTRLESYPELHYVAIVDPNGVMRRPTWPRIALPADGLDVGQREYFKRATKAKTAVHVLIGHPVLGGATNRRSLHLARPLFDADGRFDGAVVAALNPDHWAQFLQSIMLDPDGATAVIHADGLMIARAPDHVGKFAADISDSDLFTRFLRESTVGVGHLVAKADGNDKILAYQLLDNYPLVATYGVSRDIALANWRRLAIYEMLAALALLAAAYYWAWRSDRSAEHMLAHGQV
ncbi:MAG TPA: cache domain-containing protein, partial [Azospirillaceae bacterium]|nr:cache domain-containing protein [Azospirillaceae bacterium]